jgi:hypothetical protein
MKLSSVNLLTALGACLLWTPTAAGERFIFSVEPEVIVEQFVSLLTTFNVELDIISNYTTLPGVMTSFVAETDPATVRTLANGVPGVGGLVSSQIPGLRYIERDSLLSTPPSPDAATFDSAANEDFIPYGIPMVQADQVSDASTGGITLCVLDTGVDTDHPDLPTNNILALDFTDEASPEDFNGHGTHVIGTISAVSNDIGLIGVASSGLINIISYKVLQGDGLGYVQWQIDAINDCASRGGDIVSMSLGGPSYSQAAAETIEYHTVNSNMLFIAAAGNSGNSDSFYPAYYDDVMSVAAVDEDEDKASFSTFNNQVEIAAPGVLVWSTWLDGDYNRISGTSMACPHVSGVAAVIWSLFPTKTNNEIRGALQQSAKDLGSQVGRDADYGFGLVQAKAAVDLLETGENTDPEPAPESPDVGVCATSPSGWTDSGGDGCDWYSSSFRCFLGGLYPDENGVDANEACCECGGGAAANCEDDSEWVDSAGDGCDWYADGEDRCELFGDGYENDGKTAQDACCVCQGTTATTVLVAKEATTGTPATESPTESGASSVFSIFALIMAGMGILFM